jgi:predicted anti-sigma-YlaC factor YlaD
MLRTGRIAPLLALLIALLAIAGCSIKKMAANGVADALTSGRDVYGMDEDPELVGDALPFALKTLESLLEIVPENRKLLLTACRGFTQYGYGYVQSEADRYDATDYERANAMRERALKLYLRARGYGLRSLDLQYKGIGKMLPMHPDSALDRVKREDVALLYWTAAAWGSAISLGTDRPELTADVSVVKALIHRGLELDEGFDHGAIHEAMVILEALPAMMGGSVDRARTHFDRAVALSGGTRAGPYVTWARSVSVQTQNRAEFDSLLNVALTIDPEKDPNRRLENILLQRRARWLLEHADDLFIGSPDTEDK